MWRTCSSEYDAAMPPSDGAINTLMERESPPSNIIPVNLPGSGMPDKCCNDAQGFLRRIAQLDKSSDPGLNSIRIINPAILEEASGRDIEVSWMIAPSLRIVHHASAHSAGTHETTRLIAS